MGINQSKKTKDYILEGLLSQIREIRDLQYQIENWRENYVTSHGDYSEFACSFFEQSEVLLQYIREFNLTFKQRYLFKKFLKKYRKFSSKYFDEREFIFTSDWAKLIKLANKVYESFKNK